MPTSVYTRYRGRSTVWAVPWWLAIFVLPFWLLGLTLVLVFALLWCALVLPWRFVIWACGSLRFPAGVDTERDEHSG